MWGVIEKSQSRILNIGLYRDLRRQPFKDSDLELLRFLSPHLERAFRLQLHLSELKTRADDLQHAIDMLATGMILFGSSGCIIHMNKAAAAILSDNDGLVTVRGQLQATHTAEALRLKQLVHQALVTSTGNGLGPGGGMTISRRLAPALQLMVTPVRNVNLGGSCPVHAIAFLVDPSQRVRPSVNILHALFGLTPAECRVALLLGDGHSPRAIADLVGVSGNTLKTQLASIYRKTGTSRQSQLVRVLSQLAVAA